MNKKTVIFFSFTLIVFIAIAIFLFILNLSNVYKIKKIVQDEINTSSEQNIIKIIIGEKNLNELNTGKEENTTFEVNNQNNEVDTSSLSENDYLIENENILENKSDYYIKVNNQANTVTIYKKDENEKYTIPYKAMICSVGDYTPPCEKYPETIYYIPDKQNTKFKWATLEGHVYGQYATRIVEGILFHSVPYSDGWKNSAKGSLEYWEYDKLGTKASLGCVRLRVEDAKWIYDNITAGTAVEFYYDDNPGPLGKPTLNKISDYPEYLRKWDPTDPDNKNPWKTYTDNR